MYSLHLQCFLFGICILLCPAFSHAQRQQRLSEIPRIDVHAHLASNMERMDACMKIRHILKNQHNIDLAMWIDLGYDDTYTKGEGLEHLADIEDKYQCRFLSCICDSETSDGLRNSPEQLVEWMDRGVVGYKIWAGSDLPIDVLENIYYKNAMRLYPRVKGVLIHLGYRID